MQALNTIVFGVYPYIALTVLVVGCIVRYDREPYTWHAQSSQLLRRRLLVTGSILFHGGILVVFFGHLFGLLIPIDAFERLGIEPGPKQVASMAGGGAAGAISLAGGILLLYRRLTDPRIRRVSSFGDVAILALLNLQLLIGLSTILVSVDHLDGAEMLKLMAWSHGIVTFDVYAPHYIADVHWIYKLHLFVGLSIFLVFPFTRLVHMLSVPIRYLWRPGYQIVRLHAAPARQASARRPGL